MRQLVTLFCSLFFTTQLLAQSSAEPNDQSGEIRYISDNLYTFMHAGPGRNFRILGSVQAGTRVTQLQIGENGQFIEIIDDKQRTGWVDADFVTNQASIREVIPELQERVRSSETALQQEQQSNELLNQQIADISSQNSQLQQQLEQLQAQSSELKAQLSSRDQSEQMEWFTRGGIIALAGLVLGILLTFLPKKRRRNDNWM